MRTLLLLLTLLLATPAVADTFTASPVKVRGSSGLNCPDLKGKQHCGSIHLILSLPGATFGQPWLAGCQGRPTPLIDQHVVLTVVGKGEGFIELVVGDRLDGRVQVYCPRVEFTP